MSLEIVGPERLSVSRSISVTAKGLKTLEVTPTPVGGKLAGCVGASVGALLAKVVGECGDGVSGIFEAADGASTDPIAMHELVQGVVLHSDSSGAALPEKMGGPLRVVFPEGVAVQDSVCKTKQSSINLKMAVKLTLSSQFELKDAKLAQELSRIAPKAILELEQEHAHTVLAMAAHYGGMVDATAANIRALDARGFTFAVTTADGAEREGVLAPFPRPLEAGTDVAAQLAQLVAEMRATAFGALGLRFRLRSYKRNFVDPPRRYCSAILLGAAALAALAAVYCARARAR